MSHRKSTSIRKKPKVFEQRGVVITVGVRASPPPEEDIYDEGDVLTMLMPDVETGAHIMRDSSGCPCSGCQGLTVTSMCGKLSKCPARLV